MTTTLELPPTEQPIDAASQANAALWSAAQRAFAALRRHPGLVAFAVYALVALIANASTWPGDPSRIATCRCGGNEDPVQAAWFLAWTPYAILHGLNPLISGYINAPKGVNLAQNTSMPLLGVLFAPLTLTVGPVATENLLRFLSFPLSAGAMFFVLRRWTRWAPAAFIGGLVYGFSPYMVGQASVHLNLSFIPLPPLILYALWEVTVRQRHAAWRSGLALGLVSTAQFYISPEILATTGIMVVIAGVVLVLADPRRAYERAGSAAIGLGIGAAVLGACIAYPVILMTTGSLHYVGPAQGRHGPYNADLLGPVLPTLSQLVAPTHIAARASNFVGGRADVDENGSYLGIPLLLLTAYLALRGWRRRWISFGLFLAAAAFVLSLGPSLLVNGRSRFVGHHLPFYYLMHLPLVEDVLPVRISLYVVLFVAIALALGLDAARDRHLALNAARREGKTTSARVAVSHGAWVVGGLVAVATVVSLLPSWPYSSESANPGYAESPGGLAAIPTGSTVLTYPYVTQFSDDAMLWQAADAMRFKLLGSYMLRRGARNLATALPAQLLPLDVEGLFANTFSPIALPGLPYLTATEQSVVATKVIVKYGRLRATAPGEIAGVVNNVDMATGAFSVIEPGLGLIGVTVNRHTHYKFVGHVFRHAIKRAEHVLITGVRHAGSINPARVRDLRRFLQIHHVGAVLVQLRRAGSKTIVAWVTKALGPPTHALHGGDLWIVRKGELSRYRQPPILAADRFAKPAG